jgi:hypothetical protein
MRENFSLPGETGRFQAFHIRPAASIHPSLRVKKQNLNFFYLIA